MVHIGVEAAVLSFAPHSGRTGRGKFPRKAETQARLLACGGLFDTLPPMRPANPVAGVGEHQIADAANMDAPPWTDSLADFYGFLVDADGALRGALGDVRFPVPKAVEKVLDVIEPHEMFFSADDLRLPLFIVNTIRKIENKPPLKNEKGFGRRRRVKLWAALVGDLDPPSELATTVRLVRVFRQYPPAKLTVYEELIDDEVSAFESTGFYSENNIKRILPTTVAFAVGIGALWSAIAANFLGLDVLKEGWDYTGEFVSSRLSSWMVVSSWVVFIVGLIGIVGWAFVRRASLDQRHRLRRIQRSLKLYLRSVDYAVSPEASSRDVA